MEGSEQRMERQCWNRGLGNGRNRRRHVQPGGPERQPLGLQHPGVRQPFPLRSEDAPAGTHRAHTPSGATAVAVQLEKTGTKEEILQFAERTNVIIQSALTDLKSLNDLYDISTFSSFETATFFPAGMFGIPPEKQEEAKKSIEPIVQRIIKFFGDHPRQRFVAVIVCYGFSDETPIAKESPLYSPLLAKMKTNNPTRQELNVKLSELRAKSIANLLVDLIKINEGLIPNPKLINYDIKWMGKGEELPYPDRVKDYKADDKRRRMVSLIWNVLPGSLYAQGLSNDTAMR